MLLIQHVGEKAPGLSVTGAEREAQEHLKHFSAWLR